MNKSNALKALRALQVEVCLWKGCLKAKGQATSDFIQRFIDLIETTTSLPFFSTESKMNKQQLAALDIYKLYTQRLISQRNFDKMSLKYKVMFILTLYLEDDCVPSSEDALFLVSCRNMVKNNCQKRVQPLGDLQERAYTIVQEYFALPEVQEAVRLDRETKKALKMGKTNAKKEAQESPFSVGQNVRFKTRSSTSSTR